MINELKKQFTLRITRANKSELTVILFDMYSTYVDEIEVAFGSNKRKDFREGIRRARACVSELMTSLNFDYEVSFNLLSLYSYVNRELTIADIRYNIENVNHTVSVMNKLAESFKEVHETDDSEPLMANTQTIYAGLTYGKNDLNEDTLNSGLNRGLLI